MPNAVVRRGRQLWVAPHIWRRRFVFWGGGLCVGVVAVLFAWAADGAAELFTHIAGRWPWLPLILTPGGLALSAWLTSRYFPMAGGSGIPQAVAARATKVQELRDRLVSLPAAAGKMVLTLLALGVGASVGREGPTVQVGAAIMNAIGRKLGDRMPGLLLAGAAAGVAAAFNTPLAGLVFAIEEMGRAFQVRSAHLVLSAVLLAGIASLAMQGDYTYFGHTREVLHGWQDWSLVLACGVVGGLMGGLFSRLMVSFAYGLPGRLGRGLKRHPVLFAAGCGLLIALLGLASGGATYGTGYEQSKALLDGEGGVSPFFMLTKFAATLLSCITGVPGGFFSPSLAIGAGMGATIADILNSHAVGAAALLGMAGYFAGVVQAPITAFVIVLEMTGNHAMAAPVMMASLIGFSISRMTGAPAVYHALAHRYLPKAAETEKRDQQAP
ncbi:chloride channel protein [Niveispirillum irakense]|uniref:chloride channel protein n=1 Tax=Niveispirillum irakense TaxID=34011 RepID=UPI0004124B6A|nr:chloride channel protein [Niveispirillum irakense]